MNFLVLLATLTTLASCAQLKSLGSVYKAMPEDNVVEESVEWVVEEGVDILTGQDIHLDLSGDSPEEGRGSKKK